MLLSDEGGKQPAVSILCRSRWWVCGCAGGVAGVLVGGMGWLVGWLACALVSVLVGR